MGDPLVIRLWAGRGLYLLVACVIIFAKLLPLDSSPGEQPAPDLLVALTAAWLLRRPDQVTPLMIFLVFMVSDMLFLRSPGLWTLLVLLGTEFLRSREDMTRELAFPMEWALVSAVFLAATLAESLIHGVFLIPKVAIGVALLHMLITLLLYPIVVAALRFGLGLRRAAPGELDGIGRRL